MIRKIAVIGSNSFSGAGFIDYALDQGTDIIGISRSPEPSAVFLPYATNSRKHAFRFFELDLNNNLDGIMRVLDDFRPDTVVNFAAQSMVAESWLNPEHWFVTNVVSSVKFHDMLRRRDWLEKYVHISTPEVYGNYSGIIKEDAPYNPSTPYAVSKAACDMSLMTFYRNYGFPVVFTRAANVFGPGQRLYRIVPRVILSIKLHDKIPLHGGGKSIRSFIHIRDVAVGTFQAALQAVPGNIYHFSTQRQISIRELVHSICGRLGVAFEKSVIEADDRPGKDSSYILDSSKARREFGWRDEITLEAGIDETASWIEANYGEIQKQCRSYVHKP